MDLNLTWITSYKKEINSYYGQATHYLGKENGKDRFKILDMHRWIMSAQKGEYIDHINHNTLDNRKSNLRVSKNEENTKNRKSKNSNNNSGYRNVFWLKQQNKWCVQLQVTGKGTRLGFFDDVHEAGRYAEEMRQKYYGEFAGKS